MRETSRRAREDWLSASDAEREEAWIRITAAAKKSGVEVKEKSWRELGTKPVHSSARR